MEENKIIGEAWGEWLLQHLQDAFGGSGLRPDVVWHAPVYETKEDEDGNEYRKLKIPESFDLVIVRPLDWKIIHNLVGKDICMEKALETVNAVLEFNSESWPERMCTDLQYDMFRKLPGKFEWLTEQTPQILYRVTMQRLTQIFGVRNIRSIDLYEDELIVHTRTGPFLIRYDNYRDRLDEVTRAMSAFMRKPIRYQYLFKLRQQKKLQNNDTTDKKES